MNNIFIILSLLSLIALPVGLIKPSWFEKLFRKALTRKQLALIFGGTTVLFFILIGITAPETPKQNTTIVQQEQTQQDVPKQDIAPQESLPTNFSKIVKVIDGDTISANVSGTNQTIRLIGINTPETVDPRKPVECFGKEASDKAKEILDGKSVRLEADSSQGEKDKYDRYLRYVFLEDGTNFNKLMIEQGYAYEYTYNTPYKYQLEFKAAQKQAMDAKRGLWADNACSSTSVTPTPNSTTNPTPTPTPVSSTHVDKDCSDFKTHSEAQAYFDAGGGSSSNNYDGLDGDHDGIACETLP
jgi:micrococcal nuclease